MFDVLVIGAGPAGVVAALRAGDLGAKTALVTRDAFGGMAAHDGPVPVRALAHAARLIRDARQLGDYGIETQGAELNYSRLLERVRGITDEVCGNSLLRKQIDDVAVVVHEKVGPVRFVDAHTIDTESGARLQAGRIIICCGGASRTLDVPGAELTSTHSDAWSLTAIPKSLIVVGGGATGAQVASIFNAFGSKVQLFQSGPRILHTEDADVSDLVSRAFRDNGIDIRENFGRIESFSKTSDGVRMNYSKDGRTETAEAEVVVISIGWLANTVGLQLDNAGVNTDDRGFVATNEFLQTSAPNIFAAGDVTGHLLLVPQAIREGFTAGTNAVRGPEATLPEHVMPIGSFTDPEYAQVGMTETQARELHDVVVASIPFDSTTRTIIDGRTNGFCKLVVDRSTRRILGCHVVGERAVEITQVAAVAMNSGLPIDQLAHVPFSFPTYTGVLGRAAAKVARELNVASDPRASKLDLSSPQ